MTRPVHILRFRDGNEFHAKYVVRDKGDTNFVYHLSCDELEISWIPGYVEPRYEIVHGHIFAIWDQE